MRENGPAEQELRKIYQWPTYPAPPAGTSSWGNLLLGIATLTAAAMYVAFRFTAAPTLDANTRLLVTALFGLFILSIYLYLRVFESFWKRLMVVLAQIALISLIIVFGKDVGSLATLFFIVIPMAFLAFDFWLSLGLLFLCMAAMFLSTTIAVGVQTALENILPYGGGFAFFAAAAVALIQQQKERQHVEYLLSDLEDAHRQLRDYAARIENLAVAEERNRIARDIHDSLGHYLTAMTMHLQAAGKLVDSQPVQAAESIQKVEDMARESLAELRRAVAALRESPLDNLPLSEALANLVNDFSSSGVLAELQVEGEPRLLPAPLKTVLYRAAQEGLTNVHKHAHASSVTVALCFAEQVITLEVLDNGVGVGTGQSGGYGLLGLRERVQLEGGRLEAAGQPQGGFRLAIEVPYVREAGGHD
jgi:signal transduction histidine kinase